MLSIMTVRAPEELQNMLKHEAKQKGLTRNALILQILWKWMNENQPVTKEPAQAYYCLKEKR